MGHIDEKIQEIRNQARKFENKDIMGKVCIKDKEYEFEDTLFFDGKMSMRIPKEFKDMPLNLAKIKYPSEQRPQIIKMNDDGSVNITLSLFNEPLKVENVKEFRDGFKLIIKRVNPACIFYEEKMQKTNNITLGYFDYKSSAVDNELYNIMFITSISDKALMGTFNCLYEDMEEWKIVIEQVMMSIIDLTKQKKERV